MAIETCKDPLEGCPDIETCAAVVVIDGCYTQIILILKKECKTGRGFTPLSLQHASACMLPGAAPEAHGRPREDRADP